MFTSNRKLMYPTDVTELFHLMWDMLDCDEAQRNQQPLSHEWGQAMRDLAVTRENLTDFILDHPIEVLDLLYRGRSSDLMLQYESPEYNSNGSPKRETAVPYVWDEGDHRKLTVREVYYGKYGKQGLQAKPALQTLVNEADEACTTRGHAMTWTLRDEDTAYAECTECGKSVTCRVKPAPNSIAIGGEAVALNCEEEK